jgi:hypothetical protein
VRNHRWDEVPDPKLLQADINEAINKCRYEPKPPVREAAVAAMQAMSKMQGAYDSRHVAMPSASEGELSAEHLEQHASMEEGDENADPSQLSQAGTLLQLPPSHVSPCLT